MQWLPHHTRIVSRTTPQILFKQPELPEKSPQAVAGKLAVDIEVNTLDPLRLAGVIVRLDDRTLFLEPRAPRPGEVVVDGDSLTPGSHKLIVSAVDNRGALGTQYVHIGRNVHPAPIAESPSSLLRR